MIFAIFPYKRGPCGSPEFPKIIWSKSVEGFLSYDQTDYNFIDIDFHRSEIIKIGEVSALESQ